MYEDMSKNDLIKLYALVVANEGEDITRNELHAELCRRLGTENFNPFRNLGGLIFTEKQAEKYIRNEIYWIGWERKFEAKKNTDGCWLTH